MQHHYFLEIFFFLYINGVVFSKFSIMSLRVKIRTLLMILKYIKYIIFCSFLAILFKILSKLMRVIKKGGAKSLKYLVTSLMCSGGGTCSRYALNEEDEESFTTQEIYYQDNNHNANIGDGGGGGSECCMDENGVEDDRGLLASPLCRKSVKQEKCDNYTTAYHSEETGRAFRCRSHKGQSDFRKLALPGALQLDVEQQQQPYSLQSMNTTTAPAAVVVPS